MESFTGEPPHRPLTQLNPLEIRLVKLYPGNFDDGVRCELEHVLLDGNKSAYTAVSYAWGDPDVTDSILLDGVRYPVTANLHSFLRHMQTILLAATRFLPAARQAPQPHYTPLRHFVLQSMLEDPEFPRDFPSTGDSVMRQLVRRHTRKVLDVAAEQYRAMENEIEEWQADALEQILDDLDEDLDEDLADNLEDDSDDESDDAISPSEPSECCMYFWIDALCINQLDVDEKNEQVGRMKEIYSNAPSVLIWLGDASESIVNSAMDLIHDIHRAGQRYMEGFTEDLNQLCSDDFVQPRVDGIRDLMELLRQAWFSRAWVVQEVATATGSVVALARFRPVLWNFLTHVLLASCKEMLSSSGELGPLRVMAKGQLKILKIHLVLKKCYHEWLHETGAEAADCRGDEEEEEEQGGEEDIGRRLKQLLQYSRGFFKATDPRDLLYALLGLLGTDDIPTELRPDYGMPFEHVFHRYAAFMIRNTQSLAFLPCYKRDLEGVPSWVPDWRYCIRSGYSNLASSGQPCISISSDGQRLKLQGIKLGRVAAVVSLASISARIDSQALFSHNTSGEEVGDDNGTIVARGILAVIRGIQELKRECLAAASQRITDAVFQTQWEAFWQWSTGDSLRAQIDMIEGRREIDLFEIVQGMSGAYFITLADTIRSMATTGLAILEDGALVSSLRKDEPLREDDVVCMLRGMRGPCVLRREGRHYSLVGECDMTSLGPSVQVREGLELHQTETFVLV